MGNFSASFTRREIPGENGYFSVVEGVLEGFFGREKRMLQFFSAYDILQSCDQDAYFAYYEHAKKVSTESEKARVCCLRLVLTRKRDVRHTLATSGISLHVLQVPYGPHVLDRPSMSESACSP